MTDLQRWEISAERRARRHDQALAKPMTAIPLAGDPRMTTDKNYQSLDPWERLLCLYASAIMQKRGLLPVDASHIDARLQPPDTVVFIQADATQAEVCRLTVRW